MHSGDLRQEDLEFKASLFYKARLSQDKSKKTNSVEPLDSLASRRKYWNWGGGRRGVSSINRLGTVVWGEAHLLSDVVGLTCTMTEPL
jgi:hypothetical protein